PLRQPLTLPCRFRVPNSTVRSLARWARPPGLVLSDSLRQPSSAVRGPSLHRDETRRAPRRGRPLLLARPSGDGARLRGRRGARRRLVAVLGGLLLLGGRVLALDDDLLALVLELDAGLRDAHDLDHAVRDVVPHADDGAVDERGRLRRARRVVDER